MFKEQMNKLKNLIFKPKIKQDEDGENKTNKRKIENLVVFVIILIITLIVINTILGKNKNSDDEVDSGYKTLAIRDSDDGKIEEDELEKKLEAILETIDGVRKCKGANHICKFKRNYANV